MNGLDTGLTKLKTIVVWAIIVLMPIFVLPTYLDPVGLPKLLLLGIGTGILVLIKAIEIIRSGKLELNIGTFDLGVLLLILVYLLGGLYRTPNKMDAFFSSGTSSLLIASGILYFAINDLKSKNKIWWAFLASGVVLGIATIFGFLGIFEKIPQLPDYLKSPLFNPAGDYLTACLYLAAVLPVALFNLISIEDLPKKILVGFSLIIVVLGLSLSVFSILPGKPNSPAGPNLATTWAITAESIKENPLWGVGPANYISAFNRFRPLSYNSTAFWPYRFNAGHDYYLTAITETGLAGAVALGVLLLSVVKSLRTKFRERTFKTIKTIGEIVPSICLVVVLAAIAVFPASILAIFVLFVLLSLAARTEKTIFNLSASNIERPGNKKIPAVALGGLIVAGIVYLTIKVSPLVAAEATFKSAFDALNKKDGKATYDLLQQSIEKSPMVDRYHASYAQINLALVGSIIGNKKTLTDDEKNTVSQLIQQAVREGQTTVALNKERSGNWEVLARIYQSIIPLAKDTDTFAIQAYNETIALDPINPNLRITLGGIYYSLGQWDNAISTFSLAVASKPDLANAHYNLAAAYREKGEIDNAIAQMQAVLSLVAQNSQDYNLAKSELEALQKKKPVNKETQGQGGESLSAPTTGTTVINPQLTLPKDATPPAAPVIPGATPTPTPKP